MIKKFFGVLVVLLLSFTVAYASDGGNYIVKVKDGYIPSEIYECLLPLIEEEGMYTTDEKTVKKYNNYFEWAEKDEVVEITHVEPPAQMNISTMSLQNPYDWVNAEFAWEAMTCGKGVNVAVIDTGCNDHIGFEGNFKGGHNYVSGKDDVTDENGHGTHVCGIIAAAFGDTVTGVAPKANVYALKVKEDGKGTTVTMIANAFNDAVNKYDCKVISVSMDFGADYTTIKTAIKNASKKGAIILAAAGNSGSSDKGKNKQYPAGYDEVISVGSCKYNYSLGEFKRSSFSQNNSYVVVCAPGEGVKSFRKTDAYTSMTGTSQATPIVSASAAILLSIKPDMTQNEFIGYLAKCSHPINDDYTGYGIIDIEAMVKECLKEEKLYISDIDADGVGIYNNTTETENIMGGFSGKDADGNYCADAVFGVIEPKTAMRFKPQDMTAEKIYLWKNFVPMIKPATVN